MASILDICAGVPRRQFDSGTILLSEGETSGRLYVLAEGSVEVLRGDTQVAVIDEAGSVFGEMSVLLNRPHTATVRATSPVGVFVFDDAESFL
ncbi:MAG TPA: cyclic nucleotide-binding domain-containing protein, partial [Alphaproteobacteria bacterium]|nr:cyclic nucleotide-binding domain-containing protein [Alphaproteobacteria bacterium]